MSFKEGVKDALGEGVKSSIRDDLGIIVNAVKTADVYEVEGISGSDISRIVPIAKQSHKLSNSSEFDKIAELVADPVVQDVSEPDLKDGWAVEVGFLGGVTDNAAETTRQAIKDIMKKDVSVRTSKLYYIKGATKSGIERICSGLLYNKLIQFCKVNGKHVSHDNISIREDPEQIPFFKKERSLYVPKKK